jgi:RNA polymerase sigma factor (TIGR02999 family)
VGRRRILAPSRPDFQIPWRWTRRFKGAYHRTGEQALSEPLLDPVRREATGILRDLVGGDAQAADRLLPVLYGQLRKLAHHLFQGQPEQQTLNPTGLVHEAYLKLVDVDAVSGAGQTHFFAVAARAMRQILVDRHRRRNAVKRGGEWQRVTLTGVDLREQGQGAVDFLALQEALEKLVVLDERQAKLVELRFFAGMEMAAIADHLGVSKTTVEAEWRHARAWLRHQLQNS